MRAQLEEHRADFGLDPGVGDREDLCPAAAIALAPDSGDGAATGLEQAGHLTQRLYGVWYVHQPQGAERRVERIVGEAQVFRIHTFERDVREVLLRRQLHGCIDHALGDVGRDDMTIRARSSRRRERDQPRSAGDIEHAFARLGLRRV